jgi:hypothetical protein
VNGIEEIKQHPFFSGLHWDNLQNEMPFFVPKAHFPFLHSLSLSLSFFILFLLDL